MTATVKQKAQFELDAEFENEKVKLAKKALQGIQGNENNIKMLEEENANLQKIIDTVDGAKNRLELSNIANSTHIRYL